MDLSKAPHHQLMNELRILERQQATLTERRSGIEKELADREEKRKRLEPVRQNLLEAMQSAYLSGKRGGAYNHGPTLDRLIDEILRATHIQLSAEDDLRLQLLQHWVQCHGELKGMLLTSSIPGAPLPYTVDEALRELIGLVRKITVPRASEVSDTSST